MEVARWKEGLEYDMRMLAGHLEEAEEVPQRDWLVLLPEWPPALQDSDPFHLSKAEKLAGEEVVISRRRWGA